MWIAFRSVHFCFLCLSFNNLYSSSPPDSSLMRTWQSWRQNLRKPQQKSWSANKRPRPQHAQSLLPTAWWEHPLLPHTYTCVPIHTNTHKYMVFGCIALLSSGNQWIPVKLMMMWKKSIQVIFGSWGLNYTINTADGRTDLPIKAPWAKSVIITLS